MQPIGLHADPAETKSFNRWPFNDADESDLPLPAAPFGPAFRHKSACIPHF